MTIFNGQAVYSKKWLQTKRLHAAKKRGFDTFPFGEMTVGKFDNMQYTYDENGETMGPANTNIITFDNKAYALYESDKPYEFVPSSDQQRNLDTLGRTDFRGQLDHPVAAHPKVDFQTSEFLLFGYNMGSRPFHVSYSVVQKGGKVTDSMKIPVETPRLMHDMAITKNHSLLFDPNYCFVMERAMSGKDPWVNYLDRPARFGVFPRHCSDSSQVKWIDVTPCGLFHFANAWEDPSNPNLIKVYGCRSEHMRTDEFGNVPKTRMHEWVLDSAAGKLVSERFLSDHLCDFPQVDQRRQGYYTRYLYAVEFESDLRDVENSKSFPYFQAVLKFDVETGEVTRHATHSITGNKNRISEAVFAPADGAADDDQGYMLLYAFDEQAGESECTIINAQSFAVEARLHIPIRVPYGFHAYWLRGEDVEGLGKQSKL